VESIIVRVCEVVNRRIDSSEEVQTRVKTVAILGVKTGTKRIALHIPTPRFGCPELGSQAMRADPALAKGSKCQQPAFRYKQILP